MPCSSSERNTTGECHETSGDKAPPNADTDAMWQVRPEVLAYHERGAERTRLADHGRAGPLEFVRSAELLERFLPAAPCSVLDVGGGPGTYSMWLRDRGGMLIATAISRFAALLDLLVRLDRLHLPELPPLSSAPWPPEKFYGTEAGMFTTAFFHLPSQLRAEVIEAGFDDVTVLNVEGPGFLIGNFDERWQDPERQDAILLAARLVETEGEVLGASIHLMAVATAGVNQ